MTRTEEFLSVLQPVGPEFLSRFTHDDHLSLSQSIDQVLKSQSMQCQRPGLSLTTFWQHPSQEQIYFSVLSLPRQSPGHPWDLPVTTGTVSLPVTPETSLAVVVYTFTVVSRRRVVSQDLAECRPKKEDWQQKKDRTH